MRAALCAVLLLACRHPAPEPADDDAPLLEARPDPARAFDDTVARIAAQRAALSTRYGGAGDEGTRAAIRAQARAFLLAEITGSLFPLWMGTPWGLGPNSTATRPHQPGMTVGCSYFVTSILGNAGLRLDDRYRFAQAPALDIQRSLAGHPRAVRRFLSLAGDDLARRIAALGDGLWLIGLSNHVGFVTVAGGEVRLVHASWSGDRQVTDEPLAPSRAIETSRRAGYFVSPVIVASPENDALIDAWLRGATVRFRAASR